MGRQCNFFYYSKAYGWILHNRFPGYEPREDYNKETLMYEGDAFYSSYYLPSAYDNAYVFLQPRGTNRNGGGANKTVYFDFPRWQSVTHRQFGVYEPKDEVSGKKYFGLPRWRDNSSNYYVRSLEKKNGRFSYGEIRYEVSAQPAPSGFEADSVVCSVTNRNNGRTAWDVKDEIIGRRNCQNIGTAA